MTTTNETAFILEVKKLIDAASDTVHDSTQWFQSGESVGPELMEAILRLAKTFSWNENYADQRRQAAIDLGVPESGHEWTDEMIRKANLREAATRIQAALMSNDSGHEKIGMMSHESGQHPAFAWAEVSKQFAMALLAELAKERVS